jgi:hypothetical protein
MFGWAMRWFSTLAVGSSSAEAVASDARPVQAWPDTADYGYFSN